MPDLADAAWLSLDPADVVWTGQPRTRRILPAALVSLIGLVAGGGLLVIGIALLDAAPVVVAGGVAVVGAGICLTALAFVGLAYRRTVETVYLLTPEYAVLKKGVFGTSVTRLPLSAVQSTSLEQDVLGNAFDYGTVAISTAGGEGATVSFTDLDDPAAARDRLRSLVGAAGGDDGGERPTPASAALPPDAVEAMAEEARALRASAERVAREVTDA